MPGLTPARKSRATLVGALSALALALAAAAPAAAVVTTHHGGPITINHFGNATPYGAPITVSGIETVTLDVNVNLTISHSFLADVDVLLVGPQGHAVMLMSDAGCASSVSNLALTFDQAASTSVPSGPVASGTYRPTNLDSPECDGGADSFPAPAPSSGWGSSLDVYNGTDPNGEWRLYVTDDVASIDGSISAWSLVIDAVAPEAPEITSAASAEATVGEPFTHTFTATGVPAATLTYSEVSLPDGVTRSGDTLSGTPTEGGEFSITATASNGEDPDAVQTFTLSVSQSPTITSPASADAAVGTPFEHTFTAEGTPAPTLSYSGVSLPEGLSLDGNTISGTPTETGDFAVTVTASNDVAPDAEQTFELSVADGPEAPTFERAPGQAEVTNAGPVVFTLTFAEAPTGLTADDFVLGGSTGGTVTLEGGPLEWTVTVSELERDGQLALSLEAGSWTDEDGWWGPETQSPWVTFDTTAPELDVPTEAIRTTTDPGQPGAVVTFDVTATDASQPGMHAAPGSAGGPGAAPAAVESQSCVPASGSFFPIGTTTVECSAVDEAGNSASASFDVIIEDDEAPVISALEDISLELADGETRASVEFDVPSASDNSGEVDVTCDLEPGTSLPEGERTVTCTAQDPSGNTSASTFTVSISAADDGEDGNEDEEVTEDEDDDLAETGSNLTSLGLSAALLLVAGAGLVIITRRRGLDSEV